MLQSIPKAGVSAWNQYHGAALELDSEAIAKAVRFMARFIRDEPQDNPAWQSVVSTCDRTEVFLRDHYETQAGFALTTALATLAPSALVKIIVDEWGIPFHSCLQHPRNGILLDASGLHSEKHMLDYWAKKPDLKNATLSIKTVVVEEIWFYGRFDDKNLQDVVSDFGRLIHAGEGNAPVEMLNVAQA